MLGMKYPQPKFTARLILPRLSRLSTADGTSPDFSNSRIFTVLTKLPRRANSHCTTQTPST